MRYGLKGALAGTLAVTFVQALAVFAVWHRFTYSRGAAVGIALAFVATHAFAATLLVMGSLFTKMARNRRAARFLKLEPGLREALGQHLAGEDRMEELQAFARLDYKLFAICVVDAMGATRGSGTRRLAEAAAATGLIRHWERLLLSRSALVRRGAVTALGLAGQTFGAVQSALGDHDPLVRVEAARVMLQTGKPEVLDAVFLQSLSEPLLTRILLGGDFMVRANDLAARAIPQALRTGEPAVAANSLEFLVGWGKFLPVAEVARCCSRTDEVIRALAVRALRFCVLPEEAAIGAIRAINDPSPAVQAAGAWLAGSLRITGALTAVSGLLDAETAETRVTAAYALAGMGPAGVEILRETATSDRARAAPAALEALEKAMIGRLADGTF